LFHRVKGGAGFLGLPSAADHAAKLENLLSSSAEMMPRQIEEARAALEALEAGLRDAEIAGSPEAGGKRNA